MSEILGVYFAWLYRKIQRFGTSPDFRFQIRTGAARPFFWASANTNKLPPIFFGRQDLSSGVRAVSVWRPDLFGRSAVSSRHSPPPILWILVKFSLFPSLRLWMSLLWVMMNLRNLACLCSEPDSFVTPQAQDSKTKARERNLMPRQDSFDLTDWGGERTPDNMTLVAMYNSQTKSIIMQCVSVCKYLGICVFQKKLSFENHVQRLRTLFQMHFLIFLKSQAATSSGVTILAGPDKPPR